MNNPIKIADIDILKNRLKNTKLNSKKFSFFKKIKSKTQLNQEDIVVAIGMTMKLSQGMADLRHKKYLETEVAYQEKAPGGTLNPTWVEWLMGYPAGYTDLKDWEILSSRKSRKKSVGQSSKQKKNEDKTIHTESSE